MRLASKPVVQLSASRFLAPREGRKSIAASTQRCSKADLADLAAERTYDKLRQLIGKLLDEFQADECLNLFRHSGYVST
jgi:hypothetical protein